MSFRINTNIASALLDIIPINDPPTAAQNAPGAVAAGAAVGVDPEAMMMLTSMGYTEAQVGAALQATDNNIER